MSSYTTRATIAVRNGRLLKLTHPSTSTGTPMNYNLFLPSSATAASPAPLLVYLSGLTCTPDNASEKGHLHAPALRRGIALLLPDTSPRNSNSTTDGRMPDLPGEHDAYDFGSGASFYLDATTPGYRDRYRMETYVADELLAHVLRGFPQLDGQRVSVAGHSMGGHGALVLFMRRRGRFRSVSAWAPVANPTACPWGVKAFTGYLGDEEGSRDRWSRHDATELVKGWKGELPCLIDVGLGDDFYKQGQLLPENFERAVKEAGVTGTTVRYHKEFDHSYYFISAFAEDHIDHAAKHFGL